VKNADPATAQETVDGLLDRTHRSSVPIRRSFLQLPDRRPGPLAAFVAGRRALGLDLWTLLHAVAAKEDWDVAAPAMVWARALGLSATAASETTISRNWDWLEERRLVRSERERRMRKVFLLREDGSGRSFERPSGKERGFFRLPYAYFRQGWNRELKLPGKATLLVCLAQKPIFSLRTEHAAGWYGISADTLQRGLDELRDLGLLQIWRRPKTAPLARYGVTYENFYRLQGPFVRASQEGEAAAPAGEEAGTTA